MSPSQRVTVPHRHNWIYGVLLSFVALSGCGAGGGNGGGVGLGGGHTAEDFTLSVSPNSVSIAAGGSASVSLSAAAMNGFSSQVSVQVSGLPAGVTASPASVSLTPGAAQQVTFSAGSAAGNVTATVTFAGTSGSVSHNAILSVAVTGVARTLSTRTRYVRTDAVTEYYLWLNTHWVVYHQATARFFVTDPFSNQIFVLDGSSQKVITQIAVPGAFAIDDTPDHATLYVGTLMGDVYSIDPVAMQVKHRYIASEIGPYGYQAFSAQVLYDGRLALLGAQGGIPSVDGSTSIAIWNPTDNSISIYGAGPAGAPTQPLCPMGNIGGFTRSADRTAVFIGSVDSDGTVCKINSSTGQLLSASVGGFTTMKIITSPNGRYLAFPSGVNGINTVRLYDAQTLNLVTTLTVNGDVSSASNFVFSADSSILFVPGASTVYAYSVASQQQIGWTPNIVVEYTSGGFAVGPPTNPIYEAADGTGLLCGPLEEGFGCLDTDLLQAGPVGTGFANAFLNPATGPASGGTVVQWQDPPTVSGPTEVFFGSSLASSVSAVSGNLTATTPPGSPGPVNVYVFSHDNGMQLIADGFSYGPSVLEVSPNYSTAEGGGIGVIYGYGFGPAGATTLPAGLVLRIGTQSAQIVGFNPNAYNELAQPFQLQSIYYTIPAGTPGSTADVSVSSSSGTTTAKAAMSYLPALKQYPLAGATLVQGVYDPYLDLYYFTDSNKLQVFSMSQGAWVNPITMPVPQGAPRQRLWGIALSADGSKLVVSDAQAGVVYLLNPLNPASVQTFPIKPSGLDSGSGILVLPAGLAVTNSGVIWLTVDVQGGTGYHNFFTLDTNTGMLTDLGIDGPGLGASDFALRVALSADNTRVYFNSEGYVFSMDTANKNMVSASVDPGCCYGDYDLAIAPNQIQVEATSYLYDSNLNGTSELALNDREIQDTAYVYGVKFSPDGSLSLQPSVQGLDVFDGRLGRLRSRIALPVPLSTNYDALVSDGKDNILIAITGTTGSGIGVVDLSSLQEPAPLPYSAIQSSEALAGGISVKGTISRARTRLNTEEPATQHRKVPHVTNPALFPK